VSTGWGIRRKVGTVWEGVGDWSKRGMKDGRGSELEKVGGGLVGGEE
jgi:hypothetical protein